MWNIWKQKNKEYQNSVPSENEDVIQQQQKPYKWGEKIVKT